MQSSKSRGTENRARQRPVSVRFSDNEWSVITDNARAKRVSVTSYVRDAALGRRVTDLHLAIVELRRLGDQLRELFEKGGERSPQVATVYAHILNTLNELSRKS